MSTAPQRPRAALSSTRNVAVSFSGELDSGELLTGTPTIEEDTTSDLTIGNKSISTGSLEINDETVPTAEAVQCSVTGFVSANYPYTLSISIGTDSTPAQTLVGSIVIARDN